MLTKTHPQISLAILIALFFLTACSTAPSTLPPGAVETAVARTVAAWTATAPVSTNTPIPSNTAAPTAISSGQTGDDIVLPEATATPTLINTGTNLIIDVTTIIGKPVPEVEEITGLDFGHFKLNNRLLQAGKTK